MKAITQEKYGSAEVLKFQDVAKPVVKDDEVLVQVHAAGVHIGDWLVMSGLPYLIRLMGYGILKPKASVLGTELAGKVETVGKNVTRFKAGDEVFGWGRGTFAEFAAVAEDALVSKPLNASFEQAAAVPISAFTALQAVRDKGEVKPGQTVLVIGASGGVGTYLVQIAKSLGAEVTGVVSTRNLEMVRSIGADHVIDYTSEEVTGRYDVVIDTAGNRSLAKLRKMLTPKGTLVIVGGSGGRWLMGSSRSLRAVLLSPFVGQSLRPFISSPNQADLVALRDLVESGDVTPVVDRTFPLADAAAAMRLVGERHAQGKVVVTI